MLRGVGSTRRIPLSLVALDWLFPPHCAGCGRFGWHWCADCQEETRRLEGRVCERCGAPLADKAQCGDCGGRDLAFEAARAWGIYSGPLRHALLALKDRRELSFGWLVANELARLYTDLRWTNDLVTAVPLANQRQRHRGYNQVELFARPFARMIGLPFSSGALWRRRETEAQFDLSPSERWKNVQEAFQADASQFMGKSVLLMDDIMTTGATAHAAASALREAGAREVLVLAIARTVVETH